MKTKFTITVLLFFTLLSLPCSAQKIRLVKDFFGTTGSGEVANNLVLKEPFVYDDKLYFTVGVGDDNGFIETSTTLWSYDGKDLNTLKSSSDPSNFLIKKTLSSINYVAFKNKLYFNARFNNSPVVNSIFSGPDAGFFSTTLTSASNVSDLFVFDANTLFFFADINDGNGKRLIRAFDNGNGPIIVGKSTSNISEPRDFVKFNNELYFTALNGSLRKLYKVGIVNPVTQVLDDDSNTFYEPENLTVINNKLYFSSYPTTFNSNSKYLHVLDPSVSQNPITNILNTQFGVDPTEVIDFEVNVNGSLKKYLVMQATIQFLGNGYGRELLIVDTSDDSYQKFDIQISTGPSFSDNSLPSNFIEFNNKLYFTAYTSNSGTELYSFDGVNVNIVKDINPGVGSAYIQNLKVVNNKLYFSASDGTVLDGTNLFEMDINENIKFYDNPVGVSGNFNPRVMAYLNQRLILTGNISSTNKQELFVLTDYTEFNAKVDSDWLNTENWDVGRPSPGVNAVIKSNTTAILAGATDVLDADINFINATGKLEIYPQGALTLNGDINGFALPSGFITIKSTSTGHGSLIHNGDYNVNNGVFPPNMVYDKYLTNNWHTISSPLLSTRITGLDFSELSVGTTNPNHIGLGTYKNDPILGIYGWEYFTSSVSTTEEFETGKGYAIKRINNGNAWFRGKTTKNSVSVSNLYQGSHLLGNPYSSQVAVNSAANTVNILSTNASILNPNSQAIYVWYYNANGGNGGYLAFNQSSPARSLSPGQGFFIRVKDGGCGGGDGTAKSTSTANSPCSFTFPKDARMHQTSAGFFKTKPQAKIEVLAVTSSSRSSTIIKYLPNTTLSLDPGYDASVFNIDDDGFKLFTHLAKDHKGEGFMLQCVSEDYENTVIPLVLRTDSNTEIVFKTEIENLPENMDVILEDKETNKFINLSKANSEYKVTLSANTNITGRFYLHTSSKTVLDIKDDKLGLLNMYYKNNALYVSEINEEVTVLVYDMLGKEAFKTTQMIENSGVIQFPISLTSGVYIVKINTKEGSIDKKFFLD